VQTEIGRILSVGLRGSEVPVRYGGEAMAVSPHTPPAAQHAISVSIGVATRNAGAQDANEQFAMAEQALQTAKKQGRNRVALSGR
jgi:PleD family two-component response regulator